MTSYKELRQQHIELLEGMIPEHLERLSWSRHQIDAERQARLRELIGIAKEQSPWHAKRLTHITADTITEADLEAIPPMTKDDLMSNWNDIVTDRRLTLELVERHLTSCEHHTYLFDQYTACASGGSSGRRGVFIYDRRGWANAYIPILRRRVREEMDSRDQHIGPKRLAYFGSHHPAHMVYAFYQTFGSVRLDGLLLLGLSDPIEDVVHQLNEFQPSRLSGYPTALQLLAHEQKEGRLCIFPLKVVVCSEPLFSETRRLLTETWGVPVMNLWGMSELGSCGYSDNRGLGLVLDDDLSIIEAVDSQGGPIPPGVRSAKIFITNLFNHALPLIRLEVTDEIIPLEKSDPRGSGHRMVAEVEGRMDEIFTYN